MLAVNTLDDVSIKGVDWESLFAGGCIDHRFLWSQAMIPIFVGTLTVYYFQGVAN